MAYREPADSEGRLLEELGRIAIVNGPPASWVHTVMVEPMDDGGMGSLRLRLPGVAATGPGHVTIGAELSFKDADGVEVIASLYLDSQGVPIELDVWKVDFAPLIAIPNPLPAAQRPGE